MQRYIEVAVAPMRQEWGRRLAAQNRGAEERGSGGDQGRVWKGGGQLSRREWGWRKGMSRAAND